MLARFRRGYYPLRSPRRIATIDTFASPFRNIQGGTNQVENLTFPLYFGDRAGLLFLLSTGSMDMRYENKNRSEKV